MLNTSPFGLTATLCLFRSPFIGSMIVSSKRNIHPTLQQRCSDRVLRHVASHPLLDVWEIRVPSTLCLEPKFYRWPLNPRVFGWYSGRKAPAVISNLTPCVSSAFQTVQYLLLRLNSCIQFPHFSLLLSNTNIYIRQLMDLFACFLKLNLDIVCHGW